MAHLGGFSEEALQLFQLAASEQGYDFSEEGETYDFARCVRPDGSAYGTSGKCRKGTEEAKGPKEPKARKTASVSKKSTKSEPKPVGFGGETVEQLRAESDAAWKRARQLEKGAVAAQAAWRKDPQNKDLLRKFQVASMGVRNEEDRHRILKDKADKLEKSQAKSPTEKLKEGSANNPAVKRREADKAKREADTQRMYDRSAQRRAEDEKKETRENSPRVKNLQDRIARGDKKAMEEMRALRAAGKVGKEPGFAPGQKARNDAKEAANVKAGKSPVADVKPTRKPRATSSELRDSQRKLFDEAKAKRAAAREAEKEAKRVERETKGDKSREARQRRMEAARAWDKAGTAADRAQRAWEREHERWSKAGNREERAKMSPAQRAEARRVDKIIKERG